MACPGTPNLWAMLGRKRRVKAPSTWISARDLERLAQFFVDIGWSTEVIDTGSAVVVHTPGGPFGLRAYDTSVGPRLHATDASQEPVTPGSDHRGRSLRGCQAGPAS